MVTRSIGLLNAIILARGGHRAWVVASAALALFIAGWQPAEAVSLLGGRVDVLDEIAFAVDGAESSQGTDPNMWRADPDGPQGPMQVSAAAAADVGGGDRFDMTQNRELGCAYLLHLYRHYASWPDAIAAYNWGPGNMDAWIIAGRPAAKFPIAVSLYRLRVLYGPAALPGMPTKWRLGARHPPRRPLADMRHPSRESHAVEQLYMVLIHSKSYGAGANTSW